jgi:hypothetical protein
LIKSSASDSSVITGLAFVSTILLLSLGFVGVFVALDSLRGLVAFSSVLGFSGAAGLSTFLTDSANGFVGVFVQVLVWAGLLGSGIFVLTDGDAVEVVDVVVLLVGLVTGVVVVL